MPTFQDFERKADVVQAFQWHVTDGAVPPYITENSYQPGTYLANVFGSGGPSGGGSPIADGDWFYVDTDGLHKIKSDAEFQQLYKPAAP